MDLENTNVHQVYDQIASHFSNTRYKPWPRVDQYMKQQSKGSLGVDVGAGNGKYMIYDDFVSLGSDRSLELCKIAQSKRCEATRNDVLQCDGLALPYRAGMDFAISIAVIHHFATKERRVEAVHEILRVLSANGTCLVYVWALEQAASRRGWDVGMDQDVMVPWVEKDTGITYQRFYHLYKEGELEEDVQSAGGVVLESGYEKDNWWCVAQRL